MAGRHGPWGSGRRLLALYPATWRARYGAEMEAVLDARPPDRRDALDLVAGAIDAHLHPPRPSMVPAMAALLAGAGWFVVALAWLAEPAPPDWPGFVAWSLVPGLVAAIAGCAATLGLSLRLGDAPHRWERAALIALLLASVVWVAALAAAVGGWAYGAITAAAADVAAIATAVLGVTFVWRGIVPSGVALVVVGAALVLPPPGGWLIATGVWTVLGLWELVMRTAAREPIGP
jgi:hypothetical protein